MLGLKLNHVSKRGHWERKKPGQWSAAMALSRFPGLSKRWVNPNWSYYGHFKQFKCRDMSRVLKGLLGNWCHIREYELEIINQLKNFENQVKLRNQYCKCGYKGIFIYMYTRNMSSLCLQMTKHLMVPDHQHTKCWPQLVLWWRLFGH